MRIVFMGTPQYAATILEEVARCHDVVAVYTKPDAVRGRGSKLVASETKLLADSLGIPVEQPRSLRDPAVQDKLRGYEPDVICVAAYSLILPQEVLDIPPCGCLNAHASLLPRWRGAAPIERAILAGDEYAGVCIMRMEAGLDTGDWCVSRCIPVGDLTSLALTDELANIAAQAMITALVHVEAGAAKWVTQDDGQSTYAAKIEKRELDLTVEDTAISALRKIRCSTDAHACKIAVSGKGVTLVSADFPKGVLPQRAAGQLVLQGSSLLIGCSDGWIEALQVKPDGKQLMDAASYARGLQGVKNGVEWVQYGL